MTRSEFDANLALQSPPVRKLVPVRRQRGFTLFEVFIFGIMFFAVIGWATIVVLIIRLLWNWGA